MDDDIQKTALRLPRDLHRKVHEAATASGRSMNAEIVARLQESFQQQLPAGTIIPAAEAAKIAEKARRHQSAQIRARVIENLNEDLSRGLVSSMTDFPGMGIELMNRAERDELFGDLLRDLKKAGYSTEFEGDELLVMLPG